MDTAARCGRNGVRRRSLGAGSFWNCSYVSHLAAGDRVFTPVYRYNLQFIKINEVVNCVKNSVASEDDKGGDCR